MPLSYETKLVAEFAITPALSQQILALRRVCFDDSAADRIYYKQLPHHRLLAYQGDQLVASVAIDHRVITIAAKPYKIFGLIDVCVNPQHRDQGIASALLQEVTQLGQQHSIDFLVLFAQDARIYQKNGFRLVDNYFQWLRIDEHQNYGVAIERIDSEVWVKELCDRKWTADPVDLLGYLF